MKILGIAALFGLAICFLILGGQGWLKRRFNKDTAWVRDTVLRFNPNPINAEQWTLAGYAVLLGILVVLIFMTPHPLIGFAFWIGILILPKIIVEWMWSRRRQKIDLQIPAAVSAMANSLRAGLTLVQAMQRLAESAPEPIRTDFRVIVNRYAYGANLEATILEAKQRLKLSNFNLFASAVLINREMGGDISETLTRISESLDKLHQMRKTVEAHTAEGRTNIKILAVAPFLVLLMLSAVDSEGVGLLFYTSRGWLVLTVAGILIGAGFYFASMITHTDI